MKRLLLVAAVLLGAALAAAGCRPPRWAPPAPSAWASPSGTPTSIVGKYFLSQRNAIDFGLAFWRWGRRCNAGPARPRLRRLRLPGPGGGLPVDEPLARGHRPAGLAHRRRGPAVGGRRRLLRRRTTWPWPRACRWAWTSPSTARVPRGVHRAGPGAVHRPRRPLRHRGLRGRPLLLLRSGDASESGRRLRCGLRSRPRRG